MSAAQGLQLAQQWAESRAAKERQAQEDVWAAEVRDQKRQAWERDKQAGLALDDQYTRLSQAPVDQTGGFASKYGLKPANVETPTVAGKYNQRQGFFPSGDSTGPGLVTSGQEPAFEVSPLRMAALDDFKLAAARRDFGGASVARSKIDNIDLSAQAAQIQKRIAGANPETLVSFAQQYTDNANIPGSMSVDPKTGLATLKLDGGEPIKMSKVQLAQYAVGLWKQSKGDPSGLEDLARIDKSLADMADKAYGRVKDTVVNANDVALKSNQMRDADRRTATDYARLGLARAAAGRAEHREPDAKLVAQMNDIVARYPDADPDTKRTMEQQHRLLSAQVATQMGRPMQLAQERGTREVPPEQLKEYRAARVALGVRPPDGDKRRDAWDTELQNLNEIYGVGEAPGGLPAKLGPLDATAKTPQVGLAPPQSASDFYARQKAAADMERMYQQYARSRAQAGPQGATQAAINADWVAQQAALKAAREAR